MSDYRATMERWLASQLVDDQEKAIIRGMSDSEAEDAFGSYMTFGTAGLRAKMTPGTSRMNILTVAHATTGLLNYIRSQGSDAMEQGVAIAYDSRNNSREFAERSAEVLTAGGVRVYIYPSLRPTPMLSYAVRRLGCAAGINVTASHNPSEYNGYKAYGSDGSQLSPEAADRVAREMASLDIFDDVPPREYADPALLTVLGDAIDEAYINEVLAEQVNPSASQTPLSFVYTPLYGCGTEIIPRTLKRAGFNGIVTVDGQMTPNGDFPGLRNPNPEFPEAFTVAIPIADRANADLIIATDPDADRVGCMSRDQNGEFKCITGNQMGALLLDYIITAYNERGTVPEGPYAVKSLVSTPLANAICEANGIRMYDVPTGFKFIGETVEKHLATNDGTFIFGFEESYGYLKGTYARDKDAVVATLLICEMAAYYKKMGITLTDALEKLFLKYGYFKEQVFSIAVTGFGAAEKLAASVEKLRNTPPLSLDGVDIVEYRDYKSGIISYKDGTASLTGQPPQNMLYYVRADGGVVIIRPSGTEPKLKIYILVSGDSHEACAKTASGIEADIRGIL